MGVLSDKVVIVSGGGRGIGRECALLAAREGACVVVNDYGGSIKGEDEGDETPPALQTARDIVAEGGKAVANFEDVSKMTGAEAMVDQALSEFGGLHAIINPAGILRDGFFHKMSEADWDAVIAVHLRGAFNMCRASIVHFRDQMDGAYVHFTSTTGLIGNLAQANYGAAKMGVVGLSHLIAMENEIKNVRSNVIAPFAWTRMVATIPVKDEESAKRVERFRTGMRADQVAQLAVALASPAAQRASGQIFAARGNEVVLFSQPRPVKSIAALEGWTPGRICEQALPALENTFTPLEASAAVFPYDPL